MGGIDLGGHGLVEPKLKEEGARGMMERGSKGGREDGNSRRGERQIDGHASGSIFLPILYVF